MSFATFSVALFRFQQQWHALFFVCRFYVFRIIFSGFLDTLGAWIQNIGTQEHFEVWFYNGPKTRWPPFCSVFQWLGPLENETNWWPKSNTIGKQNKCLPFKFRTWSVFQPSLYSARTTIQKKNPNLNYWTIGTLTIPKLNKYRFWTVWLLWFRMAFEHPIWQFDYWTRPVFEPPLSFILLCAAVH